MSQHKVKFKRYNCVIEKLAYRNDRIALELIDEKNGEPVLVATVNILKETINTDEVIIKNYSENEGILEVLIRRGILSFPLRYACDNPGMPICKLLI